MASRQTLSGIVFLVTSCVDDIFPFPLIFLNILRAVHTKKVSNECLCRLGGKKGNESREAFWGFAQNQPEDLRNRAVTSKHELSPWQSIIPTANNKNYCWRRRKQTIKSTQEARDVTRNISGVSMVSMGTKRGSSHCTVRPFY